MERRRNVRGRGGKWYSEVKAVVQRRLRLEETTDGDGGGVTRVTTREAMASQMKV